MPIPFLPMGVLQADTFKGAQWLTIPAPAVETQGAKWIWVQRPGEPRPTKDAAGTGTVRLVREWKIEGTPNSARIWFTADNESRVRINGVVVGESKEWERLNEVDVRSALKTGANRIEVEATNGLGTGANPGGFLFVAKVENASGEEKVVSDEAWTSPDGTVTEIGPFDTEPWSLRAPEGPSPVFRHDFQLRPKIKSAMASVIGLGHYDFYVNGQRQGDGLLNQPWSQYDKTIYWQGFDVTKSLKAGPNALGVELGNSFFRVGGPPPGRHTKGDVRPDFGNGHPYLLAVALDVTYADGQKERIVSDRNWRWRSGPYILSHVYAGEDYDARLTDPNWAKPGVKPEGWNEPVVVDAPKANLRPILLPTFRVKQTWKPTRILNPRPGVWSYVFPQNAMATLRFRVRGKRGATVKFKPSEVMTGEGIVEQLNLWGGEASSHYTLRGGRSESSEWRFFYHGFQYVEMTGAVPAGKPNPEGLPVLESLEMAHVRVDNPEVGAFHSSNDLFNRTHDLVDWAMRSNMTYVLSDCPQREKLGWMECNHLLFSSFTYRYNTQWWFKKIAQDIRDVQLTDGRFLNVAPSYLSLPPDSAYQFTVEWGAAGVLMPWQAYRWYGDSTFVVQNSVRMRQFVDWIAAHAQDGIAPQGLGDWYDYGHGQPPGPSRYTPTDLTSTAMWAMCVEAVAEMAKKFGSPDTAAKYRKMHGDIRTAFLRRFYDPATKTFKNGGSVQTGSAMALCANLVPEADRAAVLDAIVKELEHRDYQQTSGDVGHLYFIRALAEGGRSDVLHKVYNRTGTGSYGGILAKGLTTLPETWDAITVGSNSLNHCMLGHVMEWFYGWVLGIRQAPGSIGWKSIVIAPEPGETTSAEGETGTPLGEVSVKWKRSEKGFRLEAVVPKGATATVVLPLKAASLTIDGRKVPASVGLFGRASVEVGPGRHVVSN